MARYIVKTPRDTYELESKNIEKDILIREKISFEKAEEQIGFILLAQRDQRWKDKYIGESHLTIGDFGCLITSLSMHSAWYGQLRYPDWMAKNLRFTKTGLLYWESIRKLPFKFVRRYYGRYDQKVSEILNSKDGAVVMEVNLGKGKHWCALVGYDQRKGFKVADPWYNDYCYVNERYGGYTGFAEITRV